MSFTPAGNITPATSLYPKEVEVKMYISVSSKEDEEYVTSTDPVASLGTDLAVILNDMEVALVSYNGMKIER